MAISSRSPTDTLSPPPSADAGSQLSSLIYEMSQHVQMAMENMLKITTLNKEMITVIRCEIDQNSLAVMEEIEKCKDSILEKKKSLEEDKERFEKAAYAVLDMLNNRA